MAQRNLGIALLGGGVVGAGVASILDQQRDLLSQRTGLSISLRHIVVRDPEKIRDLPIPATTDAVKAIDDPKVDVVVELIGGTTASAECVELPLRLGKP